MEIIGVSVVDDGPLSKLTSAIEKRDLELLMESATALVQTQTKLSKQIEINHQIITRLRRLYPQVTIVSQQKLFPGVTESYDQFGTTLVDIGIFKPEQNVTEVTVGHLSHSETQSIEATIHDHCYAGGIHFTTTAELKMKEEKLPQLIAGMVHVGSQATVTHIKDGNIIDCITIYGIMYVSSEDKAKLMKLQLSLTKGTATLEMSQDTIKFEDAIGRILNKILS